ncbi:di-heme-cytochrome C peroxidase [Shimia abyssi]|uniref:di-heme-cytochrome C peroxidase n=1 Tax=Shimia abyssi TaxID=1662395 RepID=UPI001A9E24AC|nr:di-heme-cytochrome C peroxidase [Shimia abyssi]
MRRFFSFLGSWKFWLIVVIGVAVLVVIGLKSPTVATLRERLTPPELPDVATLEMADEMGQNWSADTRHRFHHTSQGTSTFPVPVEWLLALEVPEASLSGLLWPNRQPRLFETGYLARFGFIPSPVSPDNPYGLPIGFATSDFQNLPGVSGKATSLGLTCAACHTGQFSYEGKRYVVDGGPSTVDLDALTNTLGAALGQTALASALPTPNRRFERFARTILGDRYGAAAKQQLAVDLKGALGASYPDRFNVLEGHGRLDALNRIGNQVFAENIDRPQNYVPISAPVNFPHIWTSSWFNWVQYDGSIMQPLMRNSGEALGVHTHVNTTAPKDEQRFSSAVPVRNLDWIEDTLAGKTHPMEAKAFGGLLSPKWPDALGAIDGELRTKGAALYAKHCSGCHLPAPDSEAFWSDRVFKKIQYTSGAQQLETELPYISVNVIPLRVVGTDPAQAGILRDRTIDTAGNIETGTEAIGLAATICLNQGNGALEQVRVNDGPMLNFAKALAALVQNTNNAWFEANGIAEADRAPYQGNRPNCLQADAGYKARPLNGVWATAPFLHNGSVPTLDDLLRPVDERPAFVQLGSLEIDPIKVGVKQPDLGADSYPPYQDGLFILDTSLPGNLNSGHGFGVQKNGDKTGVIGPAFTDEERAAIIEFLKSI